MNYIELVFNLNHVNICRLYINVSVVYMNFAFLIFTSNTLIRLVEDLILAILCEMFVFPNSLYVED